MLISSGDFKTCIFWRQFCVIIGPENVYLDTKIIFPSDLETEILIHVYYGGYFKNGRQ